MGKCIFSFDKIEILNQKSDTNHSDNDWLCMTWSINDKVYSKPVSLRNIAGTQVLHSGDVLSPFQDYVVCENTDTVIVTYSVINLSSYDWGKQAEAAADFVKKVADIVAPIYLDAAVVVLGVVSSGGLDAPVIIQQIAGGSAPLLDKLSDVAGGLIDKAFDEAMTPALKWVVEFFAELLGGQPNCNGEVFHDYVIFLPNQPQSDLHISKTYEGPQTNSSCGNAPHTKVDITMHREWDVETQAEWRLCQYCHVLFFNGYDTKGVCALHRVSPITHAPLQVAHTAMGFNFVLPHDAPIAGQPDWRFCNKCDAMFYNGDANKGVCPAGGGHVAEGYHFVLPVAPSPVILLGRANWRFCNKCHAMFFDGFPDSKGICPAGGGHVAEGYHFVLQYQ
jgi:hypothetical protein